jgi:hypothetical protein
MQFHVLRRIIQGTGKLFYHIAATNGKVHPSEKESLYQLIQSN